MEAVGVQGRAVTTARPPAEKSVPTLPSSSPQHPSLRRRAGRGRSPACGRAPSSRPCCRRRGSKRWLPRPSGRPSLPPAPAQWRPARPRRGWVGRWGGGWLGIEGKGWAGVGRSGQEWADCLPCAGRCHNPAPPATNTSPTPFYPHLVSLQAAREKREAARARKEANTARSAVVQTITKASTLQRMLKSKKARKSLRKADTVQVS